MKIAILGNYSTQFLKKRLEKKLAQVYPTCLIYQADFNTIDFELINTNSGLYKFKPEIIIWHESTLGLRDLFYTTEKPDRQYFYKNYLNRVISYLENISNILPNAKILFPNHSLHYNDTVFGNYGLKNINSWIYQCLTINFKLLEIGQNESNFYLIESLPASNNIEITNYALVVNAELHFTLEFTDWLTDELCKLIQVLSGKFKKCVILDLDNTLWGGIIGDDGLENIHIGNFGIGKAFTRFQKWLKELKNRGIILAVCSKNNEEIAKTPFIHHKDMVLSLDDFALFVSNWESKADNINYIKEVLNIGFDSIVFIDDNPAEREIVRKNIPQITVPELPLDAAEYLPFLISLNLFETVSISENDDMRTLQYQTEAKRIDLAKSITNMDEFLESLNMEAIIHHVDGDEIERVAQLSQRSNQFNLRTIRYTYNDILSIVNNSNYLTVSVTMKDKFGTYGLIAAVFVEINKTTAFIESWFMSCRVLKRNVEHALMNYIVEKLKEQKISHLEGEFIASGKNNLVLNLLSDLGMVENGKGKFKLNLLEYKNHKHFIKIIC